MSRLLGDVEVRETSESYSRWGERSTSVSTRTRPILEPARPQNLIHSRRCSRAVR